MLRKRTRSVQKDQHQMGHHKNHNQQPVSEPGSESFFNSDVGNKNPKNSSFYTIPGLLVGLSPKGLALTDSDSVRSPTSPLDFRLFSGLGNPSRPSSTRPSFSHENGQQRSYVGGGTSKLGLISIIDSLDDDMKFSGKVLRSSSSSTSSESSKNILFGPQLRIINKAPNGTNSFESPKSLPKNYAIFPHPSKPKSPLQQKKDSSDVLFEIGDSPLEPDSFGKIRPCSLDSYRTISNLSGLRNNSNNPNSNSVTTQVSSTPQFTDLSTSSKTQLSGSNNLVSTIPGSKLGSSGNGLSIGSLSASEIELSEDYTCVISHGPNPKTTHIFGDCILETHSNDLVTNFGNNSGLSNPIATATNNPSSEIISVPFPSDHFLSFCYSCNKKLEDGKDIYIYRSVATEPTSTITIYPILSFYI